MCAVMEMDIFKGPVLSIIICGIFIYRYYRCYLVHPQKKLHDFFFFKLYTVGLKVIKLKMDPKVKN